MLIAQIFALLLAVVTPQPSPTLDASTIVARIEQRNPSLQSFQARVHVDIHMLTFPWLSPKLDGTSYYKRPNNYEVVFDRVPSYANGIKQLFADVADPSEWVRDWTIGYRGTESVDGHSYLALRMTKKIHSDQITDTVAYVDPSTYQVMRMDWHYTNGGTIAMTQTYKQQDTYNVIATQHADIRIPRVHAVANATYAEYQTNVAVNDAVFTKK